MKSSVVLACLAAGLCPAATYHVAPDGSDRNSGSADHPWATLQHAVDAIAPGDLILVRAGTYSGARITNSGTSKSPKTLRALPSGRVVLTTPGPDNAHDSILEVEQFGGRVTDWVIGGFEVAGAPRYGIDVRVTDRITIENNHVHNSGSTGIFTAFSNHVVIQNNESDHNGEHGIYQSNSSDYAVIRSNWSHHNAKAGIHMNGDLSEGPPGIIRFATVEANVIWENGAKGASAINCDGVDDSEIRGNLIRDNHASGISLYGIDAAHSSSNNKVYNNTIVMAAGARWVINIPDDGQSAPPVGNEIKRNVLCTPDVKKGSIVTWGAGVKGFDSDENVVVDRFSADNDNSIITLGQWQALGYDKHSRTGCDALMKTPFISPAH